MPGLKYYKVDLHTHTPASSCYANKSHSPKDIVEKAKELGLDGIAVTDHNSGLWIDKMKDAALDIGLAIIPGVEISLSAGFHIVALFDIDATKEKIENFLGGIDIQENDYGKSSAMCKLSPSEVVGKIHSRDGLAILAHIDQVRGAFNHLAVHDPSSGELVSVPSECALLLSDLDYDAVECVEGILPNGFDKDHGIIRTPTHYQSSDNPDPNNHLKHSMEGIGSRFTYFKMEEINIEGLRQCFIDSEVRVCLQDEFRTLKFPRIRKIEIDKGGFFRNPSIEFHEGLNSIVGGKGVGKSVLIEFLRFGLGQTSPDEDLLKDHIGKLEKRLTRDNSVSIHFHTENDEDYVISRTFRGTRLTDSGTVLIGSPQITKGKTGTEFKGRVDEFFPVLAYSQTEVIKISENKNAQLNLIDRFIDTNTFKSQIATIQTQLSQNDKKLSVAIDAQARLDAVEDDINGLKEKIRLINEALSDPIFDAAQAAEDKWATFNKHIRFLDDLRDEVSTLSTNIGAKRLVSIPEILKNDKSVKEIKALIAARKKNLVEYLQNYLDEVSKDRKKAISIRNDYQKEYNKVMKDYSDFLSDAGGDRQDQENARQQHQKQLDEQSDEAKGYRRQIGGLAKLRKSRNELLDQLETVHSDYFEIRNSTFSRISGLSKGKVQLTIEHASDKSNFSSTLVESLKGGNNAPQASMRRQLADKLNPRRLIDLVIDRDAQALSTEAEISELWAGRIIEKFWSSEDFSSILAIQYSNFPSDVPYIKFRKPSGEYEEISDLSVGQKCTALIIIALCDGTMPVIIDQPEDALDIVSVWEDVAQKLRIGKDSRQFILTTHNSSIAVSADSDQFIVLEEAGGDHGKVLVSGSIDNPAVRDEVMTRLEGGPVPYDLRAKKYSKSAQRK